VSGRHIFDVRILCDDEPPQDAPIEQLRYCRYFEVRLGIAPLTSSGKIGLVFVQRTLSELWNQHERVGWQEGNCKTIPQRWENVDTYGTFNGPPDVFEEYDTFGRLDPFEIWMRSDQHTVLPTTLSEAHRNYVFDHDDYHAGPHLVEEVTPWTCMKYLGLVDDKTVKCLVRADRYSMPLECPADTVGALIEASLHSDEADDRIDTLLKADIDRRCLLLDSCLERRRFMIEENKRKLLLRWGISRTNKRPRTD
jgi:hypothetical protein